MPVRAGVSLFRGVAAALVPTLIAFAASTTVFASTGAVWLPMTAGLVVSAKSGGMASGLLATIASSALVWWFLIPPAHTLGAAAPAYYFSIAVFLAIGFAISLLHERLRRATEGLALTARQNHIFAALIENSVDFIGIADPDGKPVYANPAARRMVELPDDVDIGRTAIADYYAPEVRAFARDTILPAMLSEGKWAGETAFRNWRTGASIPVLDTHFLIRDPATQRVIGAGTITRDISQRKRDEEALRRAATDLREAQRVAHVGSWRMDAISHEVVWSEELYRIYGLDPAKPRRKPLFADEDLHLFSAEGRERASAAVEKALADGTPYELELEFTRPDGTTGWVVGRGEPVRDSGGRIIALTGTAADITKLKELQRLRDEWTSVIAHDLRQPIGTILMASDFLPELRGEGMTDKERTLVDRVHAAGLTLRRMVDDLLDMSLLEADRLKLECTSIGPASLVRETVARLAHLPGIERVHVSADDNLSPVLVDPMRMEQVVTNLVTNAIKYGDERSDISIRVTERAGESEISVTNRGRGIGPEELPRLFNRFMRSKEARGSAVAGLGLGLYIAKGVVQAHGGRLWAESTPGETTTFHIALPVSAEMRQAA